MSNTSQTYSSARTFELCDWPQHCPIFPYLGLTNWPAKVLLILPCWGTQLVGESEYHTFWGTVSAFLQVKNFHCALKDFGIDSFEPNCQELDTYKGKPNAGFHDRNLTLSQAEQTDLILPSLEGFQTITHLDDMIQNTM